MGSCATLPLDTMNKKLAAFEITYNEMLGTVGKWIDENRLNSEQKAQVKNMIKQISEARAAVYMAKGIVNVKDMQTNLNAANKALALLRELIAAQEQKQSSNAFTIQAVI